MSPELDCVPGTRSQNTIIRGAQKNTDLELLRINSWSEDGDVVLSAAALEGPDLWFEVRVDNKIFMSDRLAEALIEIGMSDVFKLQLCRIAGDAQIMGEAA